MSTKQNNIDNVKYEEQNLSMLTKELKTQTKELEKQIQAMQDNNLILWKLPDNIGEALKSTTPDIAAALQKGLFQSNLDKIKEANTAIDEMLLKFDKKVSESLTEADRQISQSLLKVKRVTSQMEEYETGSFKKKLMIGILAFIMLVASCCISAYIVHKKFPGKVIMHHNGNMQLENNSILIYNNSPENMKGKDNKKTYK